jgi:hypothetical protein
MRHSSQSKQVRGYRIHVYQGARYQPPSITTPLMWREDPPMEEWQHTITHPATQQAWMMQSGRKMKQFQFRREGAS